MATNEEERFALECEGCLSVSWIIRTDKDANIKFLECKECHHKMGYRDTIPSEVETLPSYEIIWNGMTLPINSELWDEWTLGKTLFDHPELLVPVRVMYVPDDEFDRVSREELVEDRKPRLWQLWKWPKWLWQYHMTRAISYRGRIYIKESAKWDRGLLLHELGHTVPFLDHSHILRPGIMNPMFFMWLVRRKKR